jgi:intracellular sulfur oxidation DsrE/DsrF family protein
VTRLAVVALLLAGLVAGGGGAVDAADPVKVVYHLNDGIDQAARAVGNIRNHLAADPTAKIVVVTHGAGIEFLLSGAKTKTGAAFSNDIDELALHGVEFRVCKNTLEVRRIDPARVVRDAKIVQSGVAEIARLQAREGYVYLRP